MCRLVVHMMTGIKNSLYTYQHQREWLLTNHKFPDHLMHEEGQQCVL